MAIQVRTLGADFADSISPEWEGFQRRVEQLSPFAHPDYLSLWLEFLGRGNRPRVIVAWDEGQLAGYAPFMEATGTFGGLPVSTLRFIGNNIGHAGDVMYADVAAIQPQKEVVGAILRHARQTLRVRKWDLGYLHPRSPTLPPARELLRLTESETRGVPPQPYVSLQLPDNWDAYNRSLSRNTRKGNARRLRKLERDGAVELRAITEPVEASEQVLNLMQKHDEWWKGTPKDGLWGGADVRQFTAQAVRQLSRQVQHAVFTLELDGTVIGWSVGVVSGARYISIMSSFDPYYAAHSPGQILSLHLLRHLISIDIRDVELGPGWNNRKRSLGGRPTEFLRILGYRGWLRLFMRLRRLWAGGRRIR